MKMTNSMFGIFQQKLKIDHVTFNSTQKINTVNKL